MLKEIKGDIKATMGIFESRDDKTYGMLAEFEDPGALYVAARSVRQAGYRRFDTHSPFPIHGMDRAMGMGNSKVGYITLAGGLAGLALAWWLQWWTGGWSTIRSTSAVSLFFAIEPSIPIMFELTVLFAAIATVVGMFVMNGLPSFLQSRSFIRSGSCAQPTTPFFSTSLPAIRDSMPW